MTENDSSKKAIAIWALMLSGIALLLCIGVFVLWSIEVMPHSTITTEAFIGTCVSLLSIIVTIAIGWQIFNIVEVKGMLKDYASKQARVEALQKQIEEELNQVKMDSGNLEHHTLHLHAIEIANHCALEGKHAEACYHYFEALAESVQMKAPLNLDQILEQLQKCLDMIGGGTIKISKSTQREINAMDEKIRSSHYFHIIKKKYESVSAEYFAKLHL